MHAGEPCAAGCHATFAICEAAYAPFLLRDLLIGFPGAVSEVTFMACQVRRSHAGLSQTITERAQLARLGLVLAFELCRLGLRLCELAGHGTRGLCGFGHLAA
ncbi:hypothetical protein [Sphingomonas sp. NFX23]|uniref:hypothetical protein n=1 Tax=Sphingomonas sp. NFX23 TaxID=2819532 RepID=UPI003CF22477